MMNFTQYLLLVLMSLPGAYRDKETWEERSHRMEVMAGAVDAASSRATCTDPYDVQECERVWPGNKKELALLLVTKAWWESRFAKNVHEGRCGEDECDATRINGVIYHRARTIWQMQQTSYVQGDEWDTMVGTSLEATRTAAWVATRILSRGKRVCRTPYGALSFYGRQRCEWNGARVRVLFYRKLSNKSIEQYEKDAERRRTRMVSAAKGN